MVYRVTSVATGGGGSPFYSTFHFSTVGGSTGAADGALAVAAFWTSLAPYISNTLHFNIDPEIAVIDTATNEQTAVQLITPPDTVNGANSSDPLPWAIQGLVRWRTLEYVAGKEVRGRTFVPGLAETGSDAGAPNSTIIGALGTAAAALIADTGNALVVYSPTHGVEEVVISYNAWNKWAYLGSRRD